MTGDRFGRERRLVFDTMVLNHFAIADRLDVLADLVAGRPCATTTVVWEELRVGAASRPELAAVSQLEWLQLVPLDRLEEVMRFAAWVRRLGTGGRDMGEASVFAVAEMYGDIALTDDRDATRVGRRYGLEVHGTIWLLAGACRAGKLTEANASTLIDMLRQTGHRLPCTGSEFPSFARRFNLL
jgi:predicted nucleic acid-binding protein